MWKVDTIHQPCDECGYHIFKLLKKSQNLFDNLKKGNFVESSMFKI